LLKTIQNEHFSVEDLNKKHTSPNFRFEIPKMFSTSSFAKGYVLVEKNINNIPILDFSHRIGSHADSFTHMQRFGCYIQPFVSPMLKLRMGFVDKS